MKIEEMRSSRYNMEQSSFFVPMSADGNDQGMVLNYDYSQAIVMPFSSLHRARLGHSSNETMRTYH